MLKKVISGANVDFRLITTKLLTFITVMILMPIAVYDLLNGRFFLSALISLYIFLLAWVTYLLHRSNRYFHIIQWCMPPLMLYTLSYASITIGSASSYWVFPGIIVLYFIMPLSTAFILNCILIAIASIAAWHHIEHVVALRFIAALIAVNLFVLLFVFVIEKQRSELKRIAITDSLTGLLNRTTLSDNLTKAIEQHRRSGVPISLIAIDLDHFKEINDKYGHAAGDQVLLNMAQILQKETRATDLVFREGGEEFLVMLYNANAQVAATQSERLRKTLLSTKGNMPTASFGVAEYHEPEDYEQWMKRADTHLYSAKKSGRNRVVSDNGSSSPYELQPNKP